MVTIDAASDSFSNGIACCVTLKVPWRFTPTTAAKAPASYSSTGAVGPAMPALLTSTSSPPSSLLTSPKRAATASGLLTSVTDPVMFANSPVTALTASALMSAMCTLAPAAANALAVASPIPLAPAVMSTRCDIDVSSSVVGSGSGYVQAKQPDGVFAHDQR